MNKNQKFTSIFFIILIFFSYLSSLANRLNIDGINIYIHAVLSTIILIFGLTKYEKIVNPITLLAPIQLSFIMYNFNMSIGQQYLSNMTITCYYTFLSCYVFGSVMTKDRGIKVTQESLIYIKRFTFALVAMGFITTIIEAYFANGFTFLTVVVDKQDGYSEQELVPILHYFVLMTALAPAVILYLYHHKYVKLVTFVFLNIICIFVVLNTLSRQSIMLLIICLFLVLSKYNSKSELKIAIGTTLFSAFIFLILGEYRILAINSDITSLEYLKASSGIPLSTPVNIIEVTFNLYTSMNFATLDNFIQKTEYFSYGSYAFRPVLDLIYQFAGDGPHIASENDTFSRLGTGISDPYLDFGLPGVAFFGYAYGFTGSVIYRNYRQSTAIGATLLWGIFCFAMLMAVFANFFNVLFIWLCFAMSIILIYQPGRRNV